MGDYGVPGIYQHVQPTIWMASQVSSDSAVPFADDLLQFSVFWNHFDSTFPCCVVVVVKATDPGYGHNGFFRFAGLHTYLQRSADASQSPLFNSSYMRVCMWVRIIYIINSWHTGINARVIRSRSRDRCRQQRFTTRGRADRGGETNFARARAKEDGRILQGTVCMCWRMLIIAGPLSRSAEPLHGWPCRPGQEPHPDHVAGRCCQVPLEAGFRGQVVEEVSGGTGEHYVTTVKDNVYCKAHPSINTRS